MTFGFDCDVFCFTPSGELVGRVGETGFPSVGVGGVIKVVGASTRFGSVAGSVVMMRFGVIERRDVVDCVLSGDAVMG